MTLKDITIAFQGRPGAYADLACRDMFPGCTTIGCASFAAAMTAVSCSETKLAMVPVQNSTAGPVNEVQGLLRDTPLHIVGEKFVRVVHCLVAPKGSTLATITHVHSHPQALAQCKEYLAEHGYEPIPQKDTAGSAEKVAQWNQTTQAAIASREAAEEYGLDIIQAGIQDHSGNTTRFLVMSKTLAQPPPLDKHCITSLRLSFKQDTKGSVGQALSVFGNLNIEIIKLDTYMRNSTFSLAEAYVEVAENANTEKFKAAYRLVIPLVASVHMFGCYPASPDRPQ